MDSNRRSVLTSGETSTVDVEDGDGGKRFTGYARVPSNSIKQWKSVILAIVAVEKFKAKIDSETTVVDDPGAQDDPASHADDPASEVNTVSQVENPASKDDPASQDDADSKLEYLLVVHKALVEQFNAFGIILTLLVAVTSVAILQPPSSFTTEGHMSPSKLVACFLMFSSVSFLLACTGLMAVIVGSASLLRPWFFKSFSSRSEAIDMITRAGQGTRNDVTVVYDDIPTLGKIILDNLLRVRRLRIYLALSLGLCMMAFVCGAYAILGPQGRNRNMALGTIIASGFVLIFETLMTLLGPTQSPKWLRRCIGFVKGVGDSEFTRATSANVRNLTMTRTASRNSGPEQELNGTKQELSPLESTRLRCGLSIC